ncbi:MAG: hypothetical protein AB7V06_28300 [Candidatus Obscuribacterales bacterium]
MPYDPAAVSHAWQGAYQPSPRVKTKPFGRDFVASLDAGPEARLVFRHEGRAPAANGADEYGQKLVGG